MKRFNLILFIVLSAFLFSCAGKPKVKDTENNEQVKENAVEQTAKPAEKIDESAVQEKKPDDLAVAAIEKPAEEPAVLPAEISTDVLPDLSAEAPEEEPLKEEITKADSVKEPPADTASLSMKSESDAARESAAVEPSVSPAPSSQTQPPQSSAPAQRQQTETPNTQSPVQQTAEETAAASEPASSDSDSQPEKEPSSFVQGGNSAPATRIESLTQMGTMPQDKEIIFSRIVRATVGQIVEIPFRGNGWVYLGEITSRRGIVYTSRRNDSDGQSFIFALEEAGTYALKFYRQDFIKDYIINDHVQIIAGEAPSAGAGWFNPPVDRGRVVAQPRWPSPVEETQIRSGTRTASEPVVTSGEPTAASAASNQTTAPQQRQSTERETNAPQRTAPARENTADRTPSQNNPPPSSAASGGQTPVTGQTAQSTQTIVTEQREKLAPEVLLQKAKETFDGGNIAAAIALLEQFMTDYPGGSDEVYWQLGQYHEANSPSRNILLSLDYYRRLVNEYPQSGRFNDARRRIAYLERYYINIQ